MGVQSKLSEVFSYQSWIHALSGAAGGCIAMSTFYPLDTVRSRLQVENSEKRTRSTLQVLKYIILTEGFRSLYRGLWPVLQSLCLSNFIYFYTFHSLKAIVTAFGNKTTPLKDLLLGIVAGIVNVFTTTPFWVVNTRLRMRNLSGTADEVNKHYDSLLSGLRYVAKTEGIRGLWSGTLASLILVSNPALQFMMYEMLKRNLIKWKRNQYEISSLGYFIIGAAAKAFATILTYPLQLVQTKQRHCSNQSSEKTNKNSFGNSTSISQNKFVQKQHPTGMIEIMLTIFRHQGVKGLFRGLEAKILQTMLTAALMFAAYEKIAKGVGLLLMRNSPVMIK